jgi:hypothetical protein
MSSTTIIWTVKQQLRREGEKKRQQLRRKRGHKPYSSPSNT